MTPEMSYESKQEVVRRMRWRYKGRGRQGRSGLIEQVCELCGYERKYAIKLLNGQAEGKRAGTRRGGPRLRYGEEEREVLKRRFGWRPNNPVASGSKKLSGCGCRITKRRREKLHLWCGSG